MEFGSEGCDGSIIVWGEDCVSSDCLADGSGTPIAATLAHQMEPALVLKQAFASGWYTVPI